MHKSKSLKSTSVMGKLAEALENKVGYHRRSVVKQRCSVSNLAGRPSEPAEL